MKTRVTYLGAAFIVIILGLSTRAYASSLPPFVAEHFGDALWASMIYLGIRSLFANKSLGWAFGVSLIFCFGIEFSQLYQASWINGIRDTTLGGLILGKGFLTVDLIRYSIGIAVTCGIDSYVRSGLIRK
ncbi:DUF2809 domain-containing protein [Cohnella mopanensis]|uniref:ribosomal maturation YjgA family protein n=1 Tax=Cohnella mopanensis TaxID=2911966 RepID=UPI001EF7AEF2|nr:DUF2809 domain-containing protein [Cohnella mopanensis]